MITSVQLALSFAAVQPAGATVDPPPETKSLLDHILSGGPIGYTIIGLSFVLVGLIIFHLIQIRESKLAPGDVVSELDGLLETGDVKGALAYCRNPANDCFLTRMFASALARCSRSPFGFLELRSALEEAGQEQVARLYRAVDAIGLIAAVAPMLGLLGTVVGMVSAFETISTRAGLPGPTSSLGASPSPSSPPCSGSSWRSPRPPSSRSCETGSIRWPVPSPISPRTSPPTSNPLRRTKPPPSPARRPAVPRPALLTQPRSRERRHHELHAPIQQAQARLRHDAHD